MGYCCENRCFNTPHAARLGWIKVQKLDGNTLRPGKTVAATLASQSESRNSGIHIVPTWAGQADKDTDIYLGFRTRKGGDAELEASLAKKVLIYTAPPNASNSFARPSSLEAVLSGETCAGTESRGQGKEVCFLAWNQPDRLPDRPTDNPTAHTPVPYC